MSPLQLTLILHTLFSYISLITSLPITSKPLENTPEHLTWEAWLMIDSKNPSDHEKSRKITPKSIFITPNFNNVSQPGCPQGFKTDQKGQCIQIVNINPADSLISRLESILPPSNTEESYDYGDDYNDSPGPFQVNIPFPPAPFKGSVAEYNDDNDSILNLETDFSIIDSTKNININLNQTDNSFHETDEIKTTTTSGFQSTQKQTEIKSNANITSTPSSNYLDVIPLSSESVPNIHTTELPTTLIDNIDELSTVTEQQMTIRTTTDRMTTTDDDEQKFVTNIDVTTPLITYSKNENNKLSKFKENDTIIISENDERIFDNLEKKNDTLKQGNDDSLMVELQNESLMLDNDNYNNNSNINNNNNNNETETTITDLLTSETTTTEYTSFTSTIEETTTTDATTINDDNITDKIETSTNQITTELGNINFMPVLDSEAQSSTMQKPIIIIPENIRSSTESLHIVTPQRTITPPETYSILKPNSYLPPSPVGSFSKINGLSETLQIENESENEKKIRETLLKQEQRETAMENIDTGNRFVYHHLGNDNHRTTSHNTAEQIKIINNIIAENRKLQTVNNRIRFPANNEYQNSQTELEKPDLVRFPGPTSHRITPVMNKLIPDKLPKNPTEEKPPFWWLPVEQNSQKPMLLRFWSRTQSSPTPNWRSINNHNNQNNRENSKSPTENLYKEISGQDIYKVLSSKNSNNNNNNR